MGKNITDQLEDLGDVVLQEPPAEEPFDPDEDQPSTWDNFGPKRGRPAGSENKKPKKSEEPAEDPQSVLYKKASESTMTMLTTVPTAFIEPEIKPYKPDGADNYLPKPGFVTDFVNLGRSTESPTLFLIWGALWTLSTVLNRNAWLQWYPKPLWPNLYVIFVAPASLCKKSTPINFGVDLLKTVEGSHVDTLEGFKNSFHFLTSKGSPEGVYMMLKPEQKTFIGGEDAPGKLFQARRTSKITLAVSELGTFLGKQQYNGGLVNLLTDLYDCKDSDAEVTRGRGVEPLEQIYATLAGAITPTGLEESIPQEALSGGLVSRTVLVFQDIPTKIYSKPQRTAGYPEPADIAPKLAWIQANCRGEYDFTPEAEKLFDEWYYSWKNELIADVTSLRDDENRKDTILRKVAMLMRVQEYRPGNDITLENLQDALRLLNFTMGRSALLMSDVSSSTFLKYVQKIKTYLENHGPTNRRSLLNRFARKFRAEEVTQMINQLISEGVVRVELDGIPRSSASGSSKEVYIPLTGGN